MNIILIQPDICWQQPELNLQNYTTLFSKIKLKSDIIILPEMFSSGYTMNTDMAETMEGMTVNWMKEQAKKNNCSICGSLPIKENNNFYNRFIFIYKEGKLDYYDKRHLFRIANEEKYYNNGSTRAIINYNGWRICPQICYDLRFPVWFRNRNDYDLLINVANWPELRKEAWKTLLKARAIENMCYVAGVNRKGIDGNGILYPGDSLVAGPEGEIASSQDDDIIEVELSLEKLRKIREAFPVHLDSDDFELIQK